MRLVIADDNVPFRTRLSSILSGIKGIEIVGVAGDVPETLDTIGRTKPDLVILDIQMPGGNGFDVLSVIKSSKASPTVIMLSVGPRSAYETMSFLMGADYFFEKSSDLMRMARLLKSFTRERKAAS
ncbi:MAG: response regulator transcription factor [Bacteroidota bacterium]|jgi:DNA-binding NarL/FixJ family response regulator